MAAMSDWLEQNVLDHSLNSNVLSANISPTTVHVSLHTADPTDADGNEVSTGQYARVPMTAGWTVAAAAGVTTAKNTAAITFPQEDTTPYIVTHFGIHDASTAGNLMYHGAISPSGVTVGIGDTASFAGNSLILESQGAFSDFLELALFKQTLNDDITSVIDVANVFCALHTADPLDDGSGQEVVVANGYARKDAGVWLLAGPDWKASNAEIDFGTASGGNWGNISHFAIWDAATNGNLFYHGELDNNKVVNDGDSLKFAANDLTIELQ